MATRTRNTWKPRADGQFDSRVGWKLNPQGKPAQHRFRIGTDLKEAKRRDQLLRQIWERIEELQPVDPAWNHDTLEIAKQVARGESVILMERADDEDDVRYAQRVHRLSRAFPMLSLTTERHYGAAFGVRLLSALERAYEAPDNLDQQLAADSELFLELLQDPRLPADGPTLHQAMRSYEQWLKKEYAHPTEEITRWGRTQIKQMQSLRNHHQNHPLSQLGRSHVEGMIQYWRQRPRRKGRTDQRVTKKTAANVLKTLMRFFRWLHTSEEFAWRKPEDLNDLNTRVMTLDDERRAQITADDVFTLDELTLLYRYGQPLDRLFLLLGLNCGFVIAESATLLVEEVYLNSPHSARYREVLDFPSTAEHSFIRRFRHKNGVYGDFLLWNGTVQGVEWALRRRRKQPDFGPQARLLLNGKGQPFDCLTKGGNPSRQIPNMFTRLKNRIHDDGAALSDLPFKALRKTGGDLVKRFSDGETMGVFHCRGTIDERKDDLADVYATRNFGKVFRALEEVEKYLAPMFAAAGPEPFRGQPQAYTSKSTIDRIIMLHNQNVSPQQIADEVGRSVATVQRHISKVTGPRRRGRPRKPR